MLSTDISQSRWRRICICTELNAECRKPTWKYTNQHTFGTKCTPKRQQRKIKQWRKKTGWINRRAGWANMLVGLSFRFLWSTTAICRCFCLHGIFSVCCLSTVSCSIYTDMFAHTHNRTPKKHEDRKRKTIHNKHVSACHGELTKSK